MKHPLLLVLVAAFALTGCTPNGAAPSSEASARPVPTVEEPDAVGTEKDALELCEIVGEKLLEYPDYVLEISDGGFTEDMHIDYWVWAKRLTAAAPSDATQIVANFTSPVYQVQEVLDAGGGSLTFSTDAYKQGTLEIMQYCVDAGYQLNQ